MDLSIVTVSYNDKEVLGVTLDAVFGSQTQYSYEMILVNNASPDGSIDMVKERYMTNPEIAAKLKIIESGGNVGFGKGNNNGMREARGDYILLLNSDTKLAPDNLQVMLDFMKRRPDVGIASCKLLLRDEKTIDKPSRRSEPNPKTSFYRLSGLQALFPKTFGGYNVLNSDPEQESELEACSGAYMMMSRKAYEATGGFDERFYHYGEDLDLCRMVREAGLKIWWYPKTTCIHYRGQSSKKEPQKNLHSFHNAMWTYYDKWYRKDSNFLMDAFVYSGIWGRYYLKSFLNYFRKNKYVSK